MLPVPLIHTTKVTIEKSDITKAQGMSTTPTFPPRAKLQPRSHCEYAPQEDITAEVSQHAAKGLAGQSASIKPYKHYLWQKSDNYSCVDI